MGKLSNYPLLPIALTIAGIILFLTGAWNISGAFLKLDNRIKDQDRVISQLQYKLLNCRLNKLNELNVRDYDWFFGCKEPPAPFRIGVDK